MPWPGSLMLQPPLWRGGGGRSDCPRSPGTSATDTNRIVGFKEAHPASLVQCRFSHTGIGALRTSTTTFRESRVRCCKLRIAPSACRQLMQISRSRRWMISQ
eukprot:5706708-Pyramimonas_sp.AAC.1